MTSSLFVSAGRTPLKNGVAIGAVIGAGLGLMTELSCGGSDDYCGQAGWVTLGSTLWGLGVGVFADVLLKTPRTSFGTVSGTIEVMERLTRDRSRCCGRERRASLVVLASVNEPCRTL